MYNYLNDKTIIIQELYIFYLNYVKYIAQTCFKRFYNIADNAREEDIDLLLALILELMTLYSRNNALILMKRSKYRKDTKRYFLLMR